MKLVCPECRRENEAERIFCHDCGARLDRSKLSKAASKEEDPKETQRRLRNLLDGRQAKMRQRFFQGSQLVLAALAMATIVQIVRPPDLPAQPEAASMTPSQINLDLENAAMDPRNARMLRYTEQQVNDYLAYTLKGKRAALSKYLEFERAIVSLEEGSCRLTAERSLFGWPLFSTVAFTPQVEDGNLTGKVCAGHVGRLPIHPALMAYAGILFADVKSALERERKSIAKLGSVTLQPKVITFLPKGQQSPLLQPPLSLPIVPQPPLPEPQP